MDNVDNHHIFIDASQINEWINEQYTDSKSDDIYFPVNVYDIGFTSFPPFNEFSLVFGRNYNFIMNIIYTDDNNIMKKASKRYEFDLEGIFGVAYAKCRERSGFDLGAIIFKFPEVGFDDFYILCNDLGNEELNKYRDGILWKFASVYRRVVSLMHCKNIELKDEPLTRQQRRRKERKNEVIYKVLAIKSSDKSTRYLEHGHSGNKHAYHLCRGHFKTYTDDAPLFGRFTGTYWWPAHVRGSKEYGEVVKDYAVVD